MQTGRRNVVCKAGCGWDKKELSTVWGGIAEERDGEMWILSRPAVGPTFNSEMVEALRLHYKCPPNTQWKQDSEALLIFCSQIL